MGIPGKDTVGVWLNSLRGTRVALIVSVISGTACLVASFYDLRSTMTAFVQTQGEVNQNGGLALITTRQTEEKLRGMIEEQQRQTADIHATLVADQSRIKRIEDKMDR